MTLKEALPIEKLPSPPDEAELTEKYLEWIAKRQERMSRYFDQVGKIVCVEPTIGQRLVFPQDMDWSNKDTLAERLDYLSGALETDNIPLILGLYMILVDFRVMQSAKSVPDVWFDPSEPIEIDQRSKDLINHTTALVRLLQDRKDPLDEPYSHIAYGDLLVQEGQILTSSQAEVELACQSVIEVMATLNERRIKRQNQPKGLKGLTTWPQRKVFDPLWEKTTFHLAKDVLYGVTQLQNSYARVEYLGLFGELNSRISLESKSKSTPLG